MKAAQTVPASVSMTNFGVFLSSPGSGRIACAREIAQRYGTEYSPAVDFYAGFVAAAKEGRRQGADELQLRRAIADVRQDARQNAYRTLVPPYLALLARFPGEWISVRRAEWVTPDLTVTITPEYALHRPDGSVDVVKLYLRTNELSRDGRDAMLFLMRERMDVICPGGNPVVFDVRREQAYRPRKRISRDFPAWLATEAGTLARLWRAVA